MEWVIAILAAVISAVAAYFYGVGRGSLQEKKRYLQDLLFLREEFDTLVKQQVKIETDSVRRIADIRLRLQAEQAKRLHKSPSMDEALKMLEEAEAAWSQKSS